jgi:hypothetical protein
MKVVINRCFGGFGISKKAVEWLAEHGSQEAKQNTFEGLFNSYYVYDDDRSNPLLVECVETLGEESFGDLSELKIVEVPDNLDFVIDNYDGMESIHEKHQIWN